MLCNTAYASEEGKAKATEGEAYIRLGSWWSNSSPSQRSVAGLRGWSATLGLRYGPNFYGRQQWGILDNGGNSDPATPRERWRSSDRKVLSPMKIMTVVGKEAPANFVPAAAVIRREQALFGFTGRKGCVGGLLSRVWKLRAQLGNCILYW